MPHRGADISTLAIGSWTCSSSSLSVFIGFLAPLATGQLGAKVLILALCGATQWYHPPKMMKPSKIFEKTLKKYIFKIVCKQCLNVRQKLGTRNVI